MPGRTRLAESHEVRTSATYRDGDLAWLGVLLACLSAALMIALLWAALG